MQALRSGAAFGAAVYRPKAVQVWLANGNPGLSANREGKVDGFDISFNITPPEDRSQSTTRVPHPYNGVMEGPYFGPDALHDFNHGQACRQKYGGLSSCSQLDGVNLNAHEQNHAKKKKYLSMLNTMGFDRFTFTVTLVNELENEEINRRSLIAEVKNMTDHPHTRLEACTSHLYWLGRCWCDKPLLRWHDRFGRVRLSFLK